MAYDAAPNAGLMAASGLDQQDFRRDERLAVLLGGASIGVMAGVGAALAFGRTDWWVSVLAVPLFAFALYFAVATFRDALERRAIGCAVAASLVAASLLAWPVTALLYPIPAPEFWIAPLAALASMVLLASCWSGTQTAVYRLGGQAMFVAMLVGFMGLNELLS